jgi:hypothetical protein
MALNISKSPFEQALENLSKTLSRTPVTKSTENISGDETLTEGSPADISGAFYRKEDGWDLKKPGLLQNADAVLLVKTDVTINKDDKITYDTENYRVQSVVTRRLGTTAFYKVARLFKI